MDPVDNELVDISINYQGEDYTVTVDLETANELLNNPTAAEQYVKKEALNLPEECAPQDTNKEDKRKVWYSKGRPSPADEEATMLFLNLRQQLSEKFNDTKTVKNKLWAEIAQQLAEAGFDICSPNPAEKCKQKFINMEKTYLKHIKHMQTTGEEKKEPPPFFSEMHSIIGYKDKVNPQRLEDTTSDVDTEDLDDNPLGEGTSSGVTTQKTKIKNRFSTFKKQSRPKSSSEIVLEELKRQHQEEQEDRKEHFAELTGLLKDQNKQRNELIGLFKEYINAKKAKYS